MLIDTELVKAWGPIFVGLLVAFISLIAVIVSFCSSYLLLRNQDRAQIRQYMLSKSEEERDDITKKLNTFYGPFKELRTQSRLLYLKLNADQKPDDKGATAKVGSRTLKNLLESHIYTDQQRALLLQILQLGCTQLKLIESQMGVVDRPSLQDLLGRLGAHIRILQLAFDKKIQGPSKAFEDIFFPLEIDGAIESAILRLRGRYQFLMSSDAILPPVKAPKPNSTVRYYDEHADQYAALTFSQDMSPLYKEFLAYVPMGGRILDAGCGVGRDTRKFIENGRIVIAFDASEAMTKKCNEYPHAYCRRLAFHEVDFAEEFDGVWACASLLHLSREEAALAASRLTTALKPGGVMFVSVKKGIGRETLEGRYFEYYDSQNASSIYTGEPRLGLLKLWTSTSTVGPNSTATDWINLLLRRTNAEQDQ